MNKLLNTDLGRKIISIILGLGFASMFRKVCESNSCLVIKGPKVKEMEKYIKLIKNVINTILIQLIVRLNNYFV